MKITLYLLMLTCLVIISSSQNNNIKYYLDFNFYHFKPLNEVFLDSVDKECTYFIVKSNEDTIVEINYADYTLKYIGDSTYHIINNEGIETDCECNNYIKIENGRLIRSGTLYNAVYDSNLMVKNMVYFNFQTVTDSFYFKRTVEHDFLDKKDRVFVELSRKINLDYPPYHASLIDQLSNRKRRKRRIKKILIHKKNNLWIPLNFSIYSYSLNNTDKYMYFLSYDTVWQEELQLNFFGSSSFSELTYDLLGGGAFVHDQKTERW